MAAKDFACSSGKIPHQTREAAESHARSIQQKDGHLPHVYTCKECGFLHVGGGRKSDRPAWLQTHNGPVLPPGKLPRKSYERRQVDKGESVSVGDAIRTYIQEHVFASDPEVGEQFGMTRCKVENLRVRLGIPGRHKRLDAVVLAALRMNPNLHRGNLASQLDVSIDAIQVRVKKFGYDGTGRRGAFGRGLKCALFGRRLTKEARSKLSEIAKTHFASPEVRMAAADKQRAWIEANPEAARERLKDSHKRAQTQEARKRKSDGLKRHYATLTPEEKKARLQKALAAKEQSKTSPETREKQAESKRRFFGSMTPEDRKAWFEARNVKAKAARALKKAAAAGGEISTPSQTQPVTADPPQPESDS